MHHFRNTFYFFYIFYAPAFISDTEIKLLTYYDPSDLEKNTWWRSLSCPVVLDLVT